MGVIDWITTSVALKTDYCSVEHPNAKARLMSEVRERLAACFVMSRNCDRTGLTFSPFTYRTLKNRNNFLAIRHHPWL